MNNEQNTANVRQAMRSLHYGLHVLTCGQGNDARAAAVTWVTQVSLRPRRLAVAVRKDSHIYPAIKALGVFALNTVGEGQEDLVSTFFKYVPPALGPSGDYTFEGHAFDSGPTTGAPLLRETPAWLECRVVEEANQGGDHGLFVAEVLNGDVRDASHRALSLASTAWSYGG